MNEPNENAFTQEGHLKVHVASAEPGTMVSTPKRKVVTLYKTVVLTAANPTAQLVNFNENRHAFQLTGGQAAATLAANDVCIGSNQGDIQNLAGKAEPLILPGKFIPAQTLGYTSAEFHGSNPVYIVALGASPTYPMYIGVADHVYVD